MAVLGRDFAERAAAENDLAAPLETAEAERGVERAAERAELDAARKKDMIVDGERAVDGRALLIAERVNALVASFRFR